MAVRVREVTAQAYYRPGPERWLVMEKLADDHIKYYVSNLPENVPLQQLLNWAHQRWTVEQGYQQLKEELGLDHFEGRSWRELHHHMVLCFMAYCFLTLVKHKRKKKP
jgi:SRSO17 transposase